MENASVLDVFVGTGALGLEALSRGAARATFLDKDAGAVRVIEENLRRTKLEGRARVVRRDAIAWLIDAGGAAADGPYDLVLVDPPYADTGALGRALELAGLHVRPRGRVIAKHFWRDAPPADVGLLASERERRFGETALTFYRRRDEPDQRPSQEETKP